MIVVRTAEHFTGKRDQNVSAVAYRTLYVQGHWLKKVSIVHQFAILLNFTRFSLGGGGSRVALRALNQASESKSVHNYDIPLQYFTHFRKNHGNTFWAFANSRALNIRDLSIDVKSSDPNVCFMKELEYHDVRGDKLFWCNKGPVHCPVQLY